MVAGSFAIAADDVRPSHHSGFSSSSVVRGLVAKSGRAPLRTSRQSPQKELRQVSNAVDSWVRAFQGQEVSFDFPVTALIGPNGGGKATVLDEAMRRARIHVGQARSQSCPGRYRGQPGAAPRCKPLPGPPLVACRGSRLKFSRSHENRRPFRAQQCAEPRASAATLN